MKIGTVGLLILMIVMCALYQYQFDSVLTYSAKEIIWKDLLMNTYYGYYLNIGNRSMTNIYI